MKKYVALILCIMCVLCFASCKKKEKEPETTAQILALAENAVVKEPVKNEFAVANISPVKIDESLNTQENNLEDGGKWKAYTYDDGRFDATCNFDKNGNMTDYKKYFYDEKLRPVGYNEYLADAKGNMVFNNGYKVEYNEKGEKYREYYYDAEGNLTQFGQMVDGEFQWLDPHGALPAHLTGETTTFAAQKNKAEKTTAEK